MPADFQQAIDEVLVGKNGIHAFIDVILICCSVGSQIGDGRSAKDIGKTKHSECWTEHRKMYLHEKRDKMARIRGNSSGNETNELKD